MRFGILGHPVVWRDGQEVRLTTRRSRAVLAYLLLSADHSASVDVLIDAIYGDTPPRSARNQVHRGVGEIRKSGITVDVQGNVYRLEAAEDEIDAFTFVSLYQQACLLADEGDYSAVAQTLETALGLWRGPALLGLDSDVFLTEAAVWNERRVAALEVRIDADLALGRHREVTARLRRLVSRYPLRERFYGQLMVALYRSQRGSEALQVFTDLEERLREELGVDPGPELQEIRLQVLRQDAALELSPPPAATPKQLPPLPGTLFGRDTELARIVTLLEQCERSRPRAVVVAGPGGAGKTSLCIAAAHHLAGGYPDGQLFADCSDPHAALPGFLTALGVPDPELPEGADACAKLLRRMISSRRMLMVLDDVRDPELIRRLLPDGSGCTIIANSRAVRVQLPGVMNMTISALAPEDARALLAARLGEPRMAAEPEAIDRVVELCGGLPTALHAAAAKLEARRHWPVSRLVERLTDPTLILDELAMRPTLQHDYGVLPARQRAVIRKMGFLGLPMVSVETVAALEDLSPDATENLMEEMVEAHLLSTDDGQEFGCHPWLLSFGAERAAAEDHPDELSAALERALGAWLVRTDSARVGLLGRGHSLPQGSALRYIPPGQTDMSLTGSAWLAKNLGMIMLLVRRAAAAGLHESCWELAIAPLELFQSGGYFEEWSQSHEIALTSVCTADNVRGQATLYHSLGQRSLLLGDYVRAGELLTRARELFARLHDDHGHGLALCLLGHLARVCLDAIEARRIYENAIDLLRAGDDRVAEADALGGLAIVLHHMDEPDASHAALDRALALCREGGSLRSEAQIRQHMAVHVAKTGRPQDAHPELLRALEIARYIEDRVMQSKILLALGTTQILLGDPEAATRRLAEAEKIAMAAGVSRVAVRARMAQAFLGGNPTSLHSVLT